MYGKLGRGQEHSRNIPNEQGRLFVPAVLFASARGAAAAAGGCLGDVSGSVRTCSSSRVTVGVCEVPVYVRQVSLDFFLPLVMISCGY